jgi:Thoeris protein ThsB, TIR-like domain
MFASLSYWGNTRFHNRPASPVGHPDQIEQVLVTRQAEFVKYRFFWRHVTRLINYAKLNRQWSSIATRDAWRVAKVRNSWLIKPEHQASPFLDKADWEQVKRHGDAATEKWIKSQLAGTSATPCTDWDPRKPTRWAQFENRKVTLTTMGSFGIYIHKINGSPCITRSAPAGAIYSGGLWITVFGRAAATNPVPLLPFNIDWFGTS